MNIEGEIAWTDLEERVRAVTLTGSGEGEPPIYPYEYATIRLERVAYADVLPTTLYVIRDNLALQVALNEALRDHSCHPLELEGGLVVGDGQSEPKTLIPPFVEETDVDGKYVLDGAHRTVLGRWQGRSDFVAIHVTGIRPDCPSYALPNSWDDIRIYEDVPSDPSLKKRYRIENYRYLYRNFSDLNGSRMRVS